MNTTIGFRSEDDYLDLVKRFPLKSIDDDAALDAAEDVLDELLTLGTLSAGANDYLEALTDLIAVYENDRVVIDAPSDADLLSHLMEAKGVTQAQLAERTGIAKSTISEILSGKKASFPKSMYGALGAFFGVDKGVFAANA